MTAVPVSVPVTHGHNLPANPPAEGSTAGRTLVGIMLRRDPSAAPRKRPDAKCPLRPGEPCTLCQASVTGPQDCGLVYRVMDDPDYREALAASKRR